MNTQIDSAKSVGSSRPLLSNALYRLFLTGIDGKVSHMSCWIRAYGRVSADAFRDGFVDFDPDLMQVNYDSANQIMGKKGTKRLGMVLFSIPVCCSGNADCFGSLVSQNFARVTRLDALPQLRPHALIEFFVVYVEQCILQREHCQAHNRMIIDSGRHRIHDAVVSQLPEILPYEQSIPLTTSVRKCLVGAAYECGVTRLNEPFTILNMCRCLGASRRKLQHFFQGALRVSPLLYLRALPINATY